MHVCLWWMRVGSGHSRCRYLHIKSRGFTEYDKRGTITLNFPGGPTVFVCLAKGSVSASTSANSSKSWQLTLCFLLLACDFYFKKCLSSSPIFFLDTQINSHPTVSPPGANWDTPEMAAIILPVCSWRDNLKIITRVWVFFILFNTTPKSSSI